MLMGYANPMPRRGPEWFAGEAQGCGVDGVICVESRSRGGPGPGPALRAAGVDLIRLATPTTDAARLPAVLEGSSGFVYYVSVAGITGKQQAQLDLDRDQRQPHQAIDRPAGRGGRSACARPSRRRKSPAWPTAWWSGRRWSNWSGNMAPTRPEHLRRLTASLAAAVHSATAEAA